MMKLVRAEREGDWPLHLWAVEDMLPYFFASSHVNYARYGLYYLRSMQCLHPTLLNPFVPNPALKWVKTDWLLRILKNSYFIARTFRLHTQVPNALEKHLKYLSARTASTIPHSSCVYFFLSKKQQHRFSVEF